MNAIKQDEGYLYEKTGFYEYAEALWQADLVQVRNLLKVERKDGVS